VGISSSSNPNEDELMPDIDATAPISPTVALCAGCAAETGFNDEAHMMRPVLDVSIACEHCGATLAGFFYGVPEDAYSGMAPGAG